MDDENETTAQKNSAKKARTPPQVDDPTPMSTRPNTRALTSMTRATTRMTMTRRGSPESIYDIDAYAADGELSITEFWHKLLNDDLIILHEVNDWNTRYLSEVSTTERSQEVDNMLKDGLDWEAEMDNMDLDVQDKEELAEKMKEIEGLSSMALLEIIGDPDL